MQFQKQGLENILEIKRRLKVKIHLLVYFFIASIWSEMSRNAKKIFPFVRGGEGVMGGFL